MTRQRKQGACFIPGCVAIARSSTWERRHTRHRNHPTIRDVPDVPAVGGRAQPSEGWSVKQGAGDQESDSQIRSSCLHYLCAPALLQLAPRKSHLLYARMTDKKRPHLPLPPTNGLKQFAVCHQLMRRENFLEPLNDNIMADFIKSEFWGEKSQMQSLLVYLPLSWKCHILVQQ